MDVVSHNDLVEADRRLPAPPVDRDALIAWVEAQLGDLYDGPLRSSRFRGGQTAADRALAAFDVAEYASRRNDVWPAEHRGASGLSPYIRHGLLHLAEVWQAVAGGPEQDVAKFRDELLWQEYARHVYARMGSTTASSMRFAVRERGTPGDPWTASSLRCVERAWTELERDGWVTNQQRMWLASHWAVRHRLGWLDGEDHMFRHLLDGSRAANRVGWQWTVGALTGRSYGFSRSQVEHRAPGLCDTCPLANECPIQEWPDAPEPAPLAPDPRLRRGAVDAWNATRLEDGQPEVVWVTAESLGVADPALQAHPELPVVFVFDVPLLTRLRLASPRLVFLAETLGDLAARRPVEVWRGDPTRVLAGRAVAATAAPVPGWRRRAHAIAPVARYAWPWLVEPTTGPIGSFSAWRRGR